MDELDHNLLIAWNRVFERCKADPVEARRRYERSLPGRILDRPSRAWCVAIRASDTRIDPGWVPDSVHTKAAHAMGGLNELVGDAERTRMAETTRPPLTKAAFGTGSRAQVAHQIVLSGEHLQRLGGPVWLKYPGLPIDEAAALLGKHKEALRSWLAHKQGRTRAARARAAKGSGLDDTTLDWQEHEPTEDRPLGVRYVPQRVLGRGDRGGGMQTPVVWSDHALDPGAAKGRPPARGWGTLWMSMAQGIPAEFEQVLERVPRVMPYGGDLRQRGWWWRCPGLSETPKAADGIRGLADGGGIHAQYEMLRPPMASAALACGRLVQKLYAPLPPWTVGRALGIDEGLQVQGQKEKWRPGVDDRWAGRRRLACETCWGVRRTSFTDDRGWNELVSYLTGGLLYGREVQQPFTWPPMRKRA